MFSSVSHILERAIQQQAFPAAVVEVGDATRPLWSGAFGRLSYAPDAPASAGDTVFDLASLTKVLATTAFVMQQHERGVLGLDDRVGEHIAAWEGADRAHVTVRDLLSHSGGLTAYVPFFRDHHGRAEFERAICSLPLEYEPGAKSIYSDLGFMLLGFILENDLALPARFDALRRHMGLAEDLQFHPPALWMPRTAPTEIDSWRRRLLVGEVHDENAAALGGAAGHAGLFGTVAGVLDFALDLLDGSGASPATIEAIRTPVRDDRTCGWEIRSPGWHGGDSCSAGTIGHTGFTGTGLWVDFDNGLAWTLLTNRVHPSRHRESGIVELRRATGEAAIRAWRS